MVKTFVHAAALLAVFALAGQAQAQDTLQANPMGSPSATMQQQAAPASGSSPSPEQSMVDHWYGDEYRLCDGTTTDIVICVNGLYERWDGRLNTAYGAVIGYQGDEQKEALRDAQRKWIAYRDANCSFYAGGEGSISRIEAATCLYVLTRDRALELEMMGQR
jgi:uncharacterized protein YecT (DUF1311 family)